MGYVRGMSDPRAAVTALFFVNGAVFSSFFARLPAIKADLGAGDGQLGLALFLATTGLVVAQPLAGALVARRGARLPALAGAAGYALSLPLAAVAPSVALLAAALFCMGVANGLLDVAINVEGVAVERERGRRVLSSMHAAFSFGGMTGAGGGALAAAAGVDPLPHLALVAALSCVVAVIAAPGLPRETGAAADGRLFVRPSRALAALGAAAFCVLLAEGSVTDWSAVYLNGSAGAAEALAAAGLTVFSLCMALGRLSGDALAERFGPAALLRVGAAVAAGGLALGLAGGTPAPGVAGFAVMGLGLGAAFPMIVGAAARTPGVDEARAIAAVSGTGYVGLMAGPAVIGVLSDAGGLRTALVLVVALCLVASGLGGALRRSPDAASE
jgi:MFS family permease